MTNEERIQQIVDLIASSRDQLNQIDKLANELFDEIDKKKSADITELESDIEFPLWVLLDPLKATIKSMGRVVPFISRVTILK
jgi:hypothetical protein